MEERDKTASEAPMPPPKKIKYKKPHKPKVRKIQSQ
jgi:hypothetical protein